MLKSPLIVIALASLIQAQASFARPRETRGQGSIPPFRVSGLCKTVDAQDSSSSAGTATKTRILFLGSPSRTKQVVTALILTDPPAEGRSAFAGIADVAKVAASAEASGWEIQNTDQSPSHFDLQVSQEDVQGNGWLTSTLVQADLLGQTSLQSQALQCRFARAWFRRVGSPAPSGKPASPGAPTTPPAPSASPAPQSSPTNVPSSAPGPEASPTPDGSAG